MSRLGIVTGLEAEAVSLAPTIRRSPTPTKIIHAAGDPQAAAQSLVDEGADSLMSLGIAGGLDPSLKPGQVIVATKVIDDLGMPYDCQESWRDELMAALDRLSPLDAPLAGYDNVVDTVSAKAELHAYSGAVAVDNESHEVAFVAARNQLPFAAVRVIADPAGRAVPSSALAGINSQGEIQYEAVFRELASHPRQLPNLVRVALDSGKAGLVLGRCAKMLFGGG